MKIRGMGYGVRRTVKILIVLLTTYHLSCPTLHADAGFLAQQAQLAWQERDKPGQTETAIHLWEQAVQAEPNRGELWIALAKAMGRAVRHSRTSKEREQWADQARAAAKKAVEKNPASAEAYAAYGEALGQWANAHKGVHSLSAVHEAVDMLQKSIAMNPQYAYAHMLLAEFYRQSPRLFSVGDKQKALEQAQKAVEYGPGYAINHLVLARACLDLGNKNEAIAELQKIGSLTPPADAIPETRADQETAVALLQSLGINPALPQCGEAGGVCTEQP
jgi:tetratricopeptide (TPR) repeat protein